MTTDLQQHIHKLVEVARSHDDVSLEHSVIWLHDTRGGIDRSVAIVVGAGIELVKQGSQETAQQLLQLFLQDASPEVVNKTKQMMREVILKGQDTGN